MARNISRLRLSGQGKPQAAVSAPAHPARVADGAGLSAKSSFHARAQSCCCWRRPKPFASIFKKASASSCTSASYPAACRRASKSNTSPTVSGRKAVRPGRSNPSAPASIFSPSSSCTCRNSKGSSSSVPTRLAAESMGACSNRLNSFFRHWTAVSAPRSAMASARTRTSRSTPAVISRAPSGSRSPSILPITYRSSASKPPVSRMSPSPKNGHKTGGKS